MKNVLTLMAWITAAAWAITLWLAISQGAVSFIAKVAPK